MSKVHVLANPAAGRGRGASVVEAATASMRQFGIDPVLLAATNRADARQCLQQVVDNGASRLIIVGGDGLAHLAIQAIATTKVTLGMIPVGTGNDFARALGMIPRDEGPDEQVRRAMSAPTALDAIRTSYGWVGSVASVGFAASVTARADQLRYPHGTSRYTVATLLEMRSLRPFPVRITVDDLVHEADVTMAVVANTAFFGGGMAICPEADPLDGTLDVSIVASTSRRTLLRFFPRVFRGTHVSHPAVTALTGRRVRIEPATDDANDRSSTAGVWGDGEFLGPMPFEAEIVPAALQVAGVRLSTDGS